MTRDALKKFFMNPYVGLSGAGLLAVMIASCSSQPTTEPRPTARPAPIPSPVIVRPPVVKPVPSKPVPKQYTSFADWKYDFIERAVQQGYNRNDLQHLMMDADYNEQVVSLDKSQAEFVKMPWEYIDSAVSSSRVSGGKRNYAAQSDVLLAAENRYGVPASIVTAIWGMESSYGAGTGNSSLTSSLATLAYDGRRRDFAESQLLALLSLVERGDIDWSQLQGSWAGGMGHTQFIPKTWQDEAVDGNHDGRRNPWNSADALTSTASYLANAGWQRGLPTFYEIRLPSNFDYRQVGQKKTVAQWQSQGVQLFDPTAAGQAVTELWLPAGKQGPAVLLTKNFDAIKVYNNSANYAMAVSLLARAIVGQSGLQQDFPRYEQPLRKYEVVQLQQRLTAQGYDTKGADGVVGNNTKLAFQRWQADHGQVPDGFISQNSATSLLR